MYKVLIVDDEKPARETLKYLINWEKTEFRIVDDAKNGKEALDKYNLYKPELIITDIVMPIMDGLEFIRKVKMIYKRQKFIILSCHENFYYAKEAIKLGASDYLLKDLLKPDDLYELLEKVKQELSDAKEIDATNAEVDISDINNDYAKEIKNVVLKSLVLEELDEAKINSIIEKFKLNLKVPYYAVLCIIVDDYKKLTENNNYNEIKELNYFIIKLINETIKEYYGGECFYNENDQFIAIIGLDNITSKLKFYADIYTICQSIRKSIFRYIDAELTIGVSDGLHDLENLNREYKKALQSAMLRIFMGKGKTIFFNTNVSKASSLDIKDLEKEIKNITEYISNNDVLKLKSELELLYNYDLSGFMQYNYLEYINTCLFNIIMDICKQYNIKYIDIFGCNYIPIEKLDEFDTIQEISDWFYSILTKLITIKKNKSEKKYSFRVKEAINYIEKNYKSDLNLEIVANALGLNKGYLSRLFKEEIGQNITDYIINFRIEKAKLLITTTNKKLYEIAREVGFPNAQYFSLKFKSITGETPLEYRNNHGQ